MHNIDLWLSKLRYQIKKHISVLIYIVYLIIFVILSFSLDIISPNINTDSARYTLSALVQSEAAILAIVVTLSLVAVQLAAASFSLRLIHLFQRTGTFWLLVFIYIISIIFGLYALIQIADNPSRSIVVDIWNPISVSFRIGIVSFFALLPHIWYTLELLKPSTIMRKLSYDITKNSIKSNQAYPRGYADPFRPIMDIIMSSLNRNDLTTFSEGLYIIRERVIYIFEHDTPFEGNEELDVLNSLNGHFNDLRGAGKKDNNVADELVVEMWIIGEKAIEKQLKDISKISAEYINDFLNQGIEEANDEIADYAVFGISALASKAIKNLKDEDFKMIVSSAIESLAKSAIKAHEKALESTLFSIYRSLAEIIINAPHGHLNDAVKTAINCLESLVKEDYNPQFKFKEISQERMKCEFQRSLGILYFHADRFEDSKRTLLGVTKFESIDRSEHKYAPRWYGEAWHVLGQIFDALGDTPNGNKARAEAALHGYSQEPN